MVFIDNFKDCMPHEISYSKFNGRDAYGGPSYDAPITYVARITYKPTKVRTSDGREQVARGVIWVGGSPVVALQDKITLPDGTAPPLLTSDRVSDENGDTHTKVYFG